MQRNPKGMICLIGLGMILVTSLFVVACGGSSKPAAAPPVTQSDAQYEAQLLQTLRHRYPLPRLGDSSDLKNQIKFATVQSDPNKIEYLELIGLDGTPYASFTIKGQVSGESTQITSPSRNVCNYDDSNNGSSVACSVLPQPDLTGTYLSPNSSEDFAYLTDGALIQWSGNFITSDQPFHITTPVHLSVDETKSITATHANITNGIKK